MKNARSSKPPARVLGPQDLSRVIGGEGTPMPAIWGLAPRPDGTPLPA